MHRSLPPSSTCSRITYAVGSVEPGRQERNMAGVSAAGARPVAIPVSATLPWLLGALLFGLLAYYFIGIDEGATSAFGNTMVVHEFVHDARHLLGFPCH
jgi:Probable cobalt transporter subunit (CbtB)